MRKEAGVYSQRKLVHHPFELMIQLFLKVKIIIKIQSTAPHITIFKEHNILVSQHLLLVCK